MNINEISYDILNILCKSAGVETGLEPLFVLLYAIGVIFIIMGIACVVNALHDCWGSTLRMDVFYCSLIIVLGCAVFFAGTCLHNRHKQTKRIVMLELLNNDAKNLEVYNRIIEDLTYINRQSQKELVRKIKGEK